MKKKTRVRPGMAPSKDEIYFFIAGILLIDLSGLNMRKVLKAFRLSAPPPGKGSKPTILTHTMKKSRQFQALKRYDYLLKMKPIAMIFTAASAMKIIENTRSIFS